MLTEDEKKKVAGLVSEFTDGDRERQALAADAYFGTGGFADGSYIWKHGREEETGYNLRKERREYRPFFRQVLDASLQAIFSQEPDRDLTDARSKSFEENADGAGNSLSAVLRGATTWSELAGGVVLVMDAPEDAPQTLAESLTSRNFPIFSPSSRRRWRSTRLTDSET